MHKSRESIQHAMYRYFFCLIFSLSCKSTYAVDDDCGLKFPWIEPALRKFAQPMFESARVSKQSTEEALQAIKDVRWGEHPPGMEQVTLKLDGQGGVNMTVDRVSKPNQPYKPIGMIKVLQRSVDMHQLELAKLLRGKPEPLRFIVETEDFPMVWKHPHPKLPAFSMCAEPAAIDIPVPDFTFEDYPETGYANTSFWAIRELLLLKDSMVPWRKRHSNVFMRHFGGVGYRKTLLPLLIGHQKNGTDREHLGLPADVVDTGYVGSSVKDFIWLDRWCTYRYLIHTAGFSYSAGLKYKMACGSVVLMFESKYLEFFYPALKAGEHYVSLPEMDTDDLHKSVFPKMKKEIHDLEYGAGHERRDSAPPVATAARKFIQEQLTPEALSCYWLKAITVYSKVYYAPDRKIPSELSFDLS